jgi:hypothetical protein
MNKTIMASIIGVVVIGAAVAVIVTRPNMRSSDAGNVVSEGQTSEADASGAATTTPADSEAGSSGKKMAFGDFIKQGGSYQCTVNQYIDAGYTSTTKGTVYISGGNIRGNYNVQVQGMSIDTSVIVRDGFVYTWTSLANIGYKAPVAADVDGAQAAQTGTGTSGTFTWNTDMIGDYDCNPWTADASQFTLPTGISFQAVVR